MKINHSLKLGTLVLGIFLSSSLMAQIATENTTSLSKPARNGFLNNATVTNDGRIDLVYKIGGDKKKNELFYEQYSFSKDLKFLESTKISEPKVDSKPDREKTYLGAWVGGGTSFDILSMKLRLYKRKELQEWNYKAQKYVRKKVLEETAYKANNQKGDFYYGVDQYNNDETGNLLIFGYVETKDKSNPKNYMLLSVDESLNIKEMPIDLKGAYSVVYSYQIPEEHSGNGLKKGDIILVFAPKKGAADLAKYLYLHYDINGNLMDKVEFQSPSTNLLVCGAFADNGSVYFAATSTDSKDPFEKVFEDYAPISNPNFRDGNNYQDSKWNKAGDQKKDFFHFVKFTGNHLDYASTVSIKDFKSKIKQCSNCGNGDTYKGKKFDIHQLYVSPNGDCLVAGQLTSNLTDGQSWYKSYDDIICLHFDNRGNLKTQYTVEKMNDDKKSSLFEMPMTFYIGKDGNSVFWEIYEVKGRMGYANWADAIANRETFYPTYFPRVSKIDLNSANISDFKVLGQKKYWMNRHLPGFMDKNENTIYYFGHDEDNENLWVGKIVLQ